MLGAAENVILIGGSAGSYDLIIQILKALPAYFTCAIIVVIHRNSKYETQIESSLSSQLEKNIESAQDKGRIKQNWIYFAPPGYHLLIEPNKTFSLDQSEPIQFSRPSIDVTFESVADVYGDKASAFLLSGANQDGSNGIAHVLRNGGQAFVQNPAESKMDVMTKYAISQNENALICDNKKIIQYFSTIN
ncbi:chemotaxis protein CheB [Sphingobacterium hungaricum]|uniref:protein-glutamate methylesterase n=1 Tax=Sphingobacterium hungaricum TaxID=2082723 RepID=A0A928UZ79_9SPHI|nr:chemotaxis protein CheB [Sphingobacterium hungaricum]MBE8713284.1 chemotaxis protein CheB [Sphingobacterium hungaricum]